jgi:hypothetical protein
MRKLNVSTLVTLDGVIQDPGGFQELDEGGWGNRYFDDEAQSYALEHLRESDAFLCGRVTFEVFKKFWPQVKEVNTPRRSTACTSTSLRGLSRSLSNGTRPY